MPLVRDWAVLEWKPKQISDADAIEDLLEVSLRRDQEHLKDIWPDLDRVISQLLTEYWGEISKNIQDDMFTLLLKLIFGKTRLADGDKAKVSWLLRMCFLVTTYFVLM